MTRRLQKSLREFDRSLAKEETIILGDLGVTREGQRYVNVPNRFPFVYVRLRSSTSELIQAYNDKVSPSYDLPVRLKREGGRYIVIGRYSERYSDWSNDNPFLHKHSDSHVFDKEGGNVGDDPVWIFPYQFMPSLVSPFSSSGAQNVFINPWLYYGETGWNYLGNTGTPELLSSKPAGSGTTLILISHEVESGNPTLVYATGTPYIPESYTGSAQLYPYIPSPSNDTDLPLAFIRLVSGTSSITWNNIYDARQYFGGGTTTLSPSTGTSNGGIDGIVFWDEGIVQGTGTVINFVGDNVSVIVSGSVAQVYVSGTSSGDISGTGVIGRVAEFVTDTKTLQAANLIAPSANILTLTNAAASTLALNITAGKTLTLTAADNYTLTIPATGTAALLGTDNTFTGINTFSRATPTSNTFIGGAGNATATAVNNIGIGSQSLLSITSGEGNVGLGFQALRNNTIGFSNFALGQEAMSGNISGSRNVAIGAGAFRTNQTGSRNVAIGFNALDKVTNSSNIGIGNQALQKLSTGENNVGIGDAVGANTTSGGSNVAIGTIALASNISGSRNIAIGLAAGYYVTASDMFVIDNKQRTNATVEAQNAYLYGSMAAGGFLQLNIPTTTNNAVKNTLILQSYVSTAATGAANGFGVGLPFYAETATDATYQQQGLISTSWVDATNATRKAKLSLSAYDTAARLGMEIEASGSAVKLGFFGGTTAVQQVLNAYTADDESAAYTGIDNAQAGTVYATVADLNALRVAYETLRASYDDLRTKLQTSTIVG